MSLNLAKYDTRTLSEEGVEIELKDPVSDEFLDVYITILGPDSKTARRLMKRLEEKQREASRHRRKADEDEDDQADLFADLIVGWRGLVFNPEKPDDTTPLPFNRPNAIRVIRALPWIAGQISDAFRDRKLFMRA